MNAITACEPLFLRLCEWIEQNEKNGPLGLNYEELRRETLLLIDQVRGNFLDDPEIANQWTQLEMPLLFFIDSTISESKLPVAAEWNRQRLAYDYRELAGDEKFFDLLDRNLKEPGAEANHRLLFFYVCLGLGFNGFYGSDTQTARTKMAEIARRVAPGSRTEAHMRICPEAYEHTDTDDLIEAPPLSGFKLFLLYCTLVLLFLTVAVFFYEITTGDLRHYLSRIMDEAGNPFEIRYRFFR